ncbi:M23 family metallopeptidase [Sphingomonas sp. RS2018]
MSAPRRGVLAVGLVVVAVAGCVAAPATELERAQAMPAPVTSTTHSDFDLTGGAVQGGVMRGSVPTGTIALTLDGKAVPVAADGRFLIAFDRDAAAIATLVGTRPGAAPVIRPLTVAPQAWRIERLPTLPRTAQPTAEFQRLRAPELAAIAAARTNATGDVDGWRQRFVWPVTGRISGLFGAQRIYAGEPGAYHSGVDVARRAGTPIVAPADGIVILAADHPFTLEGNLLMLDHGMGLNSAFLHLSRILVRPGKRVRQGEVIGEIGSTGRATGPHMHWGMKWGEARIDPMLLAGNMPKGG